MKISSRRRTGTLLLSVLIIVSSAALAYAGPTTFKYGGYVKFDAIHTQYYNGEVSPNNPIRDFYIPALIPVGADDNYYHVDYHAKESRFNLETRTDFGDFAVRGFVELDFLLSASGDERVSNSWNPRMRHLFFSTQSWLAGQTWTTFMILVLPDNLDFIGASDGVVFGRQPMVRFTKNWLQIALENPQVTFTRIEDGTRFLLESSTVPDIVAKGDFKGDWGMFGLSAIARDIQLNDPTLGRPRKFGFGASLGSELKVGDDDVKFSATVGRGLGRYVGLNFVNAAGVDSTGSMWLVDQVAGFIAYRHHWNEKWRSTADVSVFYADNPSQLPGSVNDNAQSASINLLYSPVSKMTIGVEYMHARRELKDGTDGRFGRVQFSARYNFSFLTASE